MALCLKGLNEQLFLRGGNAAENGVSTRGPGNLFGCIYACHIDERGGVGKAGPLGNGTNSRRVIARNDLYIHPFALKIGQGFLGAFANNIRNDDGAKRRQRRKRLVCGNGLRGPACNEHTRPIFNLLHERDRQRFGQQAFGGAQNQSAVIAKRHATPFALGGKGNLIRRLVGVAFRKIAVKRLKGSIVIVGMLQKGTDHFFHRYGRCLA